jgi:cysteinyl-tRNA synthetase
MSKSSGNVVLVKDVIARGLDPLSLRFCFMENRYRSQMDLSWSSIQAAHNLLERWRRSYQEWLGDSAAHSLRVADLVTEIAQEFGDDLDTPQAILKLRAIERSDFPPGEKRALFETLDPLFGLNLLELRATKSLPDEARELIEARARARAERDFKSSDSLRDQLASLGIEVRDTADGQEWSWRIS